MFKRGKHEKIHSGNGGRHDARKGKSATPAPMNEETEVAELQRQIDEESPEPGTQSSREMRFVDLPLSHRTLEGLQISKLEVTTEIQAAAIPHALAGRDILGAAKTGSGKTLSFVVPILEKLYRERWSQQDGLGALVISPTRELALQIFEVLRKVGRRHQFSAGLVTGGKKEFEGEQERIVRMNILIATPGRLLQHLEQTPGFDASNILMLVLDEADRILDMGFRSQLDSILEYLPVSRQTLLFSATQTKSVKDLARLSLKQPEYLAVHAEDQEVTPKQLVQNYIVCRLPEKLDILFSFIKNHLKSKMIVFFSTCAQARFVHECFCGMQPGVPLTALHGKVKQERRTMIYMDFLKKSAACLFATDIAARGLDFPNVDWVIQVDAPEDAAMYIHRVGRTARYTATGRALLMLMPHEEASVLQALEAASVPIKKLTVNPNRSFSVAAQAAALLAAQPEARLYAKKAFTSYLRSIQLLPHYPVKDIRSLPCDEFATALGLPFTPDLPVVQVPQSGEATTARDEARDKKNVNRQLDKLKKQIKEAKEAKKNQKMLLMMREKTKGNDDEEEDDDDDDSEEDEEDEDDDEDDDLLGSKPKPKIKKDKLKIPPKIAAAKKSNHADGDDGDDGDDFLTVKLVHHWNKDTAMDVEGASEEAAAEDEQFVPAMKEKNKKPKKVEVKIAKDGSIKVKHALGPKKIIFDEDGEAVPGLVLRSIQDEEIGKDGGRGGGRSVEKRITSYTTSIKQRVDAGRMEDEERDKQRLKDQRQKRKQVERDARRKHDEDEDGDENQGPTLAYVAEDEPPASDNSDDDDNDDDEDMPSSHRKRSLREDSDDDGGDNDDDDGNDDDDLEAQEALALALLDNKSLPKRQRR